MRVIRAAALVAMSSALLAPAGHAKFGIVKTKLVLTRTLPPEVPILAERVFVDARSEGPEVTRSALTLVRSRLQEAFRTWPLYQLVERERDAEATVVVSLSGLEADLRDEVRMESRRVKIGEREEWDEKKKKMVKRDVYGDRDQPVSWRVAEGSLDGTVEIDPGTGARRTREVRASYGQSHKREDRMPDEMASESGLRQWLAEEAATSAVAAVARHSERIEALLAVNGELKEGNRLAQAGRITEALAEWSRRSFKGDTEAARVHNVGVAYEALAYGIPPHDAEHKDLLEKAQVQYRRAQQLDPDEKYFADPPERIAASLSIAGRAAAQMDEIERHRQARRAAERPPVARRAENAEPAGAAGLLRNPSFERSVDPWLLAGRGGVVSDESRGSVLELAAGSSAAQAVGIDLEPGAASLGLEYKIVSGEGRIRVRITYADAEGRTRISSLEVTAGEGPGPWSSWSGNVGGIRPRPKRLLEVRLEAEDGAVRLDNVSLLAR